MLTTPDDPGAVGVVQGHPVLATEPNSSRRRERSVRGKMKLAVLFALALAAGCAPTNVQQQSTTYTQLPRPDVVLVYDFAVSPDEVKLDTGLSAELMQKYAAYKGTPPTAQEIQARAQGGQRRGGRDRQADPHLRHLGRARLRLACRPRQGADGERPVHDHRPGQPHRARGRRPGGRPPDVQAYVQLVELVPPRACSRSRPCGRTPGAATSPAWPR